MRSSEEPISAQPRHFVSEPENRSQRCAGTREGRHGRRARCRGVPRAAAAVAMADDGYAVDDVGQRGSQSASAATDVTAPAVGVMDMDQESQQGCAAAEHLGDADPKVTKGPRALRLLRISPPETPNGGHARSCSESVLCRLLWICSVGTSCPRARASPPSPRASRALPRWPRSRRLPLALARGAQHMPGVLYLHACAAACGAIRAV